MQLGNSLQIQGPAQRTASQHSSIHSDIQTLITACEQGALMTTGPSAELIPCMQTCLAGVVLQAIIYTRRPDKNAAAFPPIGVYRLTVRLAKTSRALQAVGQMLSALQNSQTTAG